MNRERTWAEILATPFWWLAALLLGPGSVYGQRRARARAELEAHQEERRRNRPPIAARRYIGPVRAAQLEAARTMAGIIQEQDRMMTRMMQQSPPHPLFLPEYRDQREAPRSRGGLGGLGGLGSLLNGPLGPLG